MAKILKLGKVEALKVKMKALKKEKELWLEQYQLVGDFVHNRKQNFTEVNEPGAFLTRDLFDNTAQAAANTSASAFLGALWPSGAQTFELLPARGLSDTEENREYLRFITEENISIMDDARSGLSVALDEYMYDQLTFGTSGIAVFVNEDIDEDNPLPVWFKAWDVKTMLIDENERGMVDTIINETEKTVRQVVSKYGLENVSSYVKDLFEKGKEEEKITIVHAMQPRLNRGVNQYGNKNKKIMSIEFELKSEKILKESGFDSMPVLVSRLRKALGEVQGRSLAMAALPDIIELNVVWEVITTGAEKVAEPPQAVLSDGDLGTTTIDTSAGAINVFNISSRLGAQKPIIDIATVGDLNPLLLIAEKLTESITNHFLIDKLLDLNNETRMTLGEANIRNELRGQSLGSVFSRQKAEIFDRIIQRTVQINFNAGRLGVASGSEEEIKLREQGVEPIIIPNEVVERMANGEEVYKIKYISPAERAIQAEEVQGNLAVMNVLSMAAPLAPEAIDVVKIDDIVRRTAELTGASKEIINGLDVIQQVRTARAQQQQQMAEAETARENSETARNMAQAMSTIQNQNGEINK